MGEGNEEGEEVGRRRRKRDRMKEMRRGENE